MKSFTIAILILLTVIQINCTGQVAQSKITDQDLTSLVISFEGLLDYSETGLLLIGDFKIIQDNGTYFGLSSTKLYCGTDKTPVWKTKLSKSMLSKIRAFISELKKTPPEVNIPSFCNDHYKASINGKEWFIKPNEFIFIKSTHNLTGEDSLPNLRFYKSIFAKQIKEYNLDYENHKLIVNNHIQKKWYYDPNTFTSMKKGSKIHLYAIPNANTTEFWEMKKDFSFTRNKSSNDNSKSKIAIEYSRQEVISLYMYLTIYADNLLERSDNSNRPSQHTSFYIIELSKDEMILQIAY